MNKFTIHFATINTECNVAFAITTRAFTIHFATINTVRVQGVFYGS